MVKIDVGVLKNKRIVTLLIIILAVSLIINIIQARDIYQWQQYQHESLKYNIYQHPVIFSNIYEHITNLDEKSIDSYNLSEISYIIDSLEKSLIYYQNASRLLRKDKFSKNDDDYMAVQSLFSRYTDIIWDYRECLYINKPIDNEKFNAAVNDLKTISKWLKSRNSSQNYSIYGINELSRETKVDSIIIKEILGDK